MSSRFFAQRFLTPLDDAGPRPPGLRFDEQRQITLDRSGQPFVVTGGLEQTGTDTRAQRDPGDLEAAPIGQTVTKMQRDPDGREHAYALVGTHTAVRRDPDTGERGVGVTPRRPRSFHRHAGPGDALSP
jgi:hypothetical protein